jgi:hypothetical protein
VSSNPVKDGGQGYTLVARQPAWLAVCEKLTSTDTVREMTVQHPATVD